MPLVDIFERPPCTLNESELNSKIFAHIHHDARLLGSHLQGASFMATVNYINRMLAYIEKNKNLFTAEQQAEFLGSFEKLKKLFLNLALNAYEVEKTTTLLKLATTKEEVDTAIKNLSSSMLKDFKENKETTEILIPGGWTGKVAGHAMAYKLIKKQKADGSLYYAFLVYNTGAGIRYHLKDDKIKEKSIPVMAYEIPGPPKLNFDQLENFVARLLRPQITPALDQDQLQRLPNWLEENTFDAKKLYADCIGQVAFLGGKKVDPKSFCRTTTHGQLSGTCAMRVLMPMLANELSGETFRHFLFQLRLQSILDHFHIQSLKGNLGDEMVQDQLIEALNKLERTTKKFRIRQHNKVPILSEVQSEEILQLKADILAELKKHAAKHIAKKEQEKLSQAKAQKSLATKEATPPATRFTLSKTIVADTKIAAARTMEPYLALPKFDKTREPLAYFKEVLERMQKNDASLHTEGIINDFEDLMLSIPIVGPEAEQYWQNLVNKPETNDVLNTLQAMLRIYGRQCYFRGGHPFAERKLASASLLIIASHIARMRFYGDQNFETWPMSELIKTSLGELILKDPASVSGDPRWDKRLSELRKFYQENLKKSEPPDDVKQKSVEKDFYDIELIWKHGLKSKLANLLRDEDTRRAADTMECARINLYKLINGQIKPSDDSAFKPLLDDVTFCNSMSELTAEYGLFTRDDFNYFKTADLSGLKSSGSSVNLGFSLNMFGITRQVGPYSFNYKFSHESKVTREAGFTINPVLRNPIIREALFPEKYYHEDFSEVREGLGQSNKVFLSLEEIAKKLDKTVSDSFPIYSAAFTRITADTARVVGTKDFLESNLERLPDKDFQLLFFYNFFTPNMLIQQCIDNPNFATTLTESIKDGFRTHLKGQELDEGAIFCIRLSYWLQKYVSEMVDRKIKESQETKATTDTTETLETKGSKEEKERLLAIESLQKAVTSLRGFDDTLKKSINTYKNIIEKTKNADERLRAKSRLKDLYDLSILRETLKLSEEGTDAFIKDPERLKDFFHRMFERNLIIAPRSSNSDAHLESEISHRLKAILPQMREMMTKLGAAESERILREAITSILVPKIFSNEQFDLKLTNFPMVEITDKEKNYTLDFSTGSIRGSITLKDQKEEAQQGIYIERTAPAEFYTQDVVRYFGNNYLVGKYYPEASNPTFEFTFRNAAHRIILDSRGEAHIQMKFPYDQKWHELQEHSQFNPPDNLPKHFTELERFWWVDAENSPPQTFYVANREEQPALVGTLEGKRGYEVQEINKEGQKTGYILHDLTKTSGSIPYLEPWLEKLKQFEDSKFICLWGLKETKTDTKQEDVTKQAAIRIALPRYNLEFYSSGEGQNLEFIWKENPEYRLSLKDLGAIPHLTDTLYLEHRKTGQFIAFIPNQATITQSKSEAETKLGVSEKLLYSMEPTPLTAILEAQKETKDDLLLLHEGAYYKQGLDRTNTIPGKTLQKKLGSSYNDKLWNYSGRESYFNFSIKDGKPTPKTVEECLFLASLYLSKHEADLAIESLRQAYKLGGLKGTLEEVELVRKIICDIPSTYANGADKARTNDPETVTARLTAAWLLADFKQSHLDKPLFSLETPLPSSPYQDNNETYNSIKANETRKFFISDFQSQVQENLKLYQTLKGNVPVESELSSEQELTLTRLAVKGVKDLKSGYDKFSITRRWRELELIAYRKEEQQLDKMLKQGRLSKLGMARLEKVRSILAQPTPYYLAQYKVATVKDSIPPINPNLDMGDTELVLNSEKLYQQYQAELKRIENRNRSEEEMQRKYPRDRVYYPEIELPPDLKDFPVPLKPSELTMGISYKRMLTSFNSFYDLARSTDKKQQEERELLKNFVHNVLRAELEAKQIKDPADIPIKNSQYYLVAFCSLFAYVLEYPEEKWPRSKSEQRFYDSFNLSSFFRELETKCLEIASKKSIEFEVTQYIPGVAEKGLTRKKKAELISINAKLQKELLQVPPSIASQLGIYSFARAYQHPKKFKERKDQKEGKEQAESAGSAISEVLDRKSFEEPFFQREAKHFAKDLIEGRRINAVRRAQYDLAIEKFKSPKFRHELLQKLKASTSAADKTLNQEEEALLKMANVALIGKSAQEKIRLQIAGLKAKPLKFADLLTLYLKNDLSLLQRTTHLDQAAAINLYQNIHQFLLNKTAHQQEFRVKKALESAAKLKETDPDFYPTLHQIAEKMSETRSFDPEKHPELLAFEYCEDISIRENQARTIEKLLQEKEQGEGYKDLVAQLIMGGGKSKVLLPLLALKKANGSNLSIIEVPKALFETNSADLRATTQKFFGKQAHPFTFSRDSSCNPDDLQALYQSLKQIIRNQEFLVTTAESVQALELKYWELLEAAPKKPQMTIPEKKEEEKSEQEKAMEAAAQKKNEAEWKVWSPQLSNLEKILKLFKNQGDALLDEVDSNLDPKKELNYTLGEAQQIKEIELQTLLEVYNLFPDIPLELSSGKTTVEQVMLGQTVLAKKTEWIQAMKNLSVGFTNNPNSPIYAFCQSLSEADKIKLQQYLFHDDLDELPKTERPILEKPKFIDAIEDYELKTKIGLLKGEIEFLKHTLARKAGENYGFPKSRKYAGSVEIAIPYIANNVPNERANFGSFYETTNYTLQLQLQKKKLSLTVIQDFVSDFHKRANLEVMKSLGTLAFDETDASKEFMKITNLPLASIHPTDNLKVYRKDWFQNKNIRDLCLFKYVLKKIKHYPTILRSDAVNHASIYRSRQGFTGTPWNYRCYHPDMHFEKKDALGVDGQTFDHLISKKTKVVTAPDRSAEALIRNHLENRSDATRIHAFIDVGALFKGKSNENIARLLCLSFLKQKRQDIQHILYFNKKNVLCAFPVNVLDKLSPTELKLLEKGELNLAAFKKIKNIKPIEIGSSDPANILAKTGSTPDHCFTYYDQSHTTGTDIKQPLNSIGITTVDINTDARSLAQGVMRMRDLPRTQEIEILISKGMSDTLPLQKPWQIQNVLGQVLNNQWTNLSNLHFQAAVQKMNNLVREDLRARIYNAKDNEEKANLYKAYREVFLISSEDDPFKQFGDLESPELTSKILDKIAVDLLKKWQNCLTKTLTAGSELNGVELESMREKLLTQSRMASRYCLTKRKHVPSGSENTEVQLEFETSRESKLQSEQETEKEKEKQKELEQKTFAERAKPWSELRHKWDSIPLTDGIGSPKVAKEEKKDQEEAPTYSAMWDSAYSRMRSREPQFTSDNFVKSLNYMLEGVWGGLKPKFAFNDNILVSDNYKKTIQSYSFKENFFDRKKPLNFILYIETPKPKSQLKAVLITDEDAVELKAMIQREKETLIKVGYRVHILSTHEDPLIQTHPGPIEHTDYDAIYEQICYFNADLDRLSHDPGRLSWLLQDSKQKLEFLDTQLLRNYPEKRGLMDSLSLAFEAISMTRALETAIMQKDSKALMAQLKQVALLPNPYVRKGVLRARTSSGRGLLNLAAESQNLTLVKALLETKEFDPLKADSRGQLPLIAALASQDDAMIEFFINFGLPPASDAQSWGAMLQLAIVLKNQKFFQLLYDKVIHFTSREDRSQILNKIPQGFDKPLLHLILTQISKTGESKEGMENLKLLLKNPEIRHDTLDQDGNSVLLHALKLNNPRISDLFLSDQSFMPEKTELSLWQSVLKQALLNKSEEQFQRIFSILQERCTKQEVGTLLIQNFETTILSNHYELVSAYVKLMEKFLTEDKLASVLDLTTRLTTMDYAKGRTIEPKLIAEGPFGTAINNKCSQSLKALLDNEASCPPGNGVYLNNWFALWTSVINSRDIGNLAVLTEAFSRNKSINDYVKSKFYRQKPYNGGISPAYAAFELLAPFNKWERAPHERISREQKEWNEYIPSPEEVKESTEFLEAFLKIPNVCPAPDDAREWQQFFWEGFTTSDGNAFNQLKAPFEKLPSDVQTSIMKLGEDSMYDIQSLVKLKNTTPLEYFLKNDDKFHLSEFRSRSDRNLLDLAAVYRNPSAIQVLLLDKKFDPNAQSPKYGQTALMCFLDGIGISDDKDDAPKLQACFELLLKTDIDFSLKDKEGNDVFDYLNKVNFSYQLSSLKTNWLKMLENKRSSKEKPKAPEL